MRCIFHAWEKEHGLQRLQRLEMASGQTSPVEKEKVARRIGKYAFGILGIRVVSVVSIRVVSVFLTVRHFIGVLHQIHHTFYTRQATRFSTCLIFRYFCVFPALSIHEHGGNASHLG